MKTSLLKPDYVHLDAIEKYRDLFLKEEDDHIAGSTDLLKYDCMEKWLLNARLFEKEETLPPMYSLAYQYIYYDEGSKEVVGMIQLRTDLKANVFLEEFGGHIGYSVSPKYRRMGHGSEMLGRMLEICKNEYHLDRVLITCLKKNEASRRTILSCGGEFERQTWYPPEKDYIERYWVKII